MRETPERHPIHPERRPSPNKPRARRDGMLRPSGGYRSLRSFQMAEIIFDATVAFCKVHRAELGVRYCEQMVQAARSGRQNIAEGSCAAATSSKSELLLTNVARSSLEELLLDYEDYLRHHKLPQWDKDSVEALAVRRVCTTQGPHIAHYGPWLEHSDPAITVNALICLCNQAIYLLVRQAEMLEARHRERGGYGEQLYASRSARRDEQRGGGNTTEKKVQETPPCPCCGKVMTRRTARQGPRAGKDFWGCSAYPECRGTRTIEG